MSEEEIEPMMEKRGMVEVGVTPSIHSGKPSEMIKQGEAILSCEDELDVACDGSCGTCKCKQ